MPVNGKSRWCYSGIYHLLIMASLVAVVKHCCFIVVNGTMAVVNVVSSTADNGTSPPENGASGCCK